MESTEKGRLSIESIGIFRSALRSLLWGQVPTESLQLVQRHTSEPRSPAGAITKAEFWPKPKDVTISGHAVHSGLGGGFQYRHVERNQFLPGWITRGVEKWGPINPPKVHAHTFQINAIGWMYSGTAERVPEIRPGSYASVCRAWIAGDTVELRLPMETKWVRGEGSNTGQWALTRGRDASGSHWTVL